MFARCQTFLYSVHTPKQKISADNTSRPKILLSYRTCDSAEVCNDWDTAGASDKKRFGATSCAHCPMLTVKHPFSRETGVLPYTQSKVYRQTIADLYRHCVTFQFIHFFDTAICAIFYAHILIFVWLEEEKKRNVWKEKQNKSNAFIHSCLLKFQLFFLNRSINRQTPV